MKPSCLQSRFVVFAIAGVVALQLSPDLAAGGRGEGNQMSPGLVAAGSDAGYKESKTLTVTKECGTATLAPGELDYCTVTASNFRPLRGAKIRYFGPGFFTGNHPFLDSWVVIESDQGGGGTAFGHCLVRGVPEVLGACQFTGGSGSLKGFKADVTVTTVDGTIWHWNGAVSSND
jgi:hypothetical protein